MNANGQCLLELCSYHGLRVTNTCFQTKSQHKVLWRHPCSKHWHQLDMIIVRCASLKFVLLACTYQSVDCDTDHLLVCCKLRLQAQKFHHTKQKEKPHIDTTKMQCPEIVQELTKSLEDALSADQQHRSTFKKWDHLHETIQKTAFATFGRKTSKRGEWYYAKSSQMTPLIEAKSAVLSEYKHSPSEKSLQALRKPRSKVQQRARRCANEYWQQLSEDIQNVAATSYIRRMYKGIKKALGPTQSKIVPFKSVSSEVITDKAKQMERWVEHYLELYSREYVDVTAALDASEPLPVMEELDAEPTLEELGKAIDSSACGKALGTDGILPDLVKCCKKTLLQTIDDILCHCWREEGVPQDMRDAKIVTLYKNKGERSDCNKNRGISLLRIIGKVYA